MEIFGFNIPLWLILGIIAFYAFYRHTAKHHGMFKELGIPGPTPWPFVGNGISLMRKGMNGGYHEALKNKYGNVIGTFMGGTPNINIFEPEILKQIMVKDFNHFQNRKVVKLHDKVMDNMLTTLKDDHWKHVRNQVTPTFSGSKLRKMVKQMNQCGQNLVDNLEIPMKAGDVFEAKVYTGAFTMDVIASTGFNIDVNTQQDPNNIFVKMAKKSTTDKLRPLKIMIFFFFPFLVPYMDKIGLSIMDRQVVDFFVDIVNKAIKQRKENPNKRAVDFLQLMISAEEQEEGETDDSKKNGDDKSVPDQSGGQNRKGLTHTEVVAQAFIFFLAGYETTANTLGFVMYNLAIHPEYQERAYQEILSVVGENEPTYEKLKELTYLQMVVDETLRIFPQAPILERVPNDDIEICGIRILKEMTISIPVHALHMDPEVWTDPKTFDPERFTPEAKEGRHPCQYMPFGLGPRNCIAMRLALVELKIALVYILRNYKVVTCEKTQIPIEMKKIEAVSKKGVWLKVESRKQSED